MLHPHAIISDICRKSKIVLEKNQLRQIAQKLGTPPYGVEDVLQEAKRLLDEKNFQKNRENDQKNLRRKQKILETLIPQRLKSVAYHHRSDIPAFETWMEPFLEDHPPENVSTALENAIRRARRQRLLRLLRGFGITDATLLEKSLANPSSALFEWLRKEPINEGIPALCDALEHQNQKALLRDFKEKLREKRQQEKDERTWEKSLITVSDVQNVLQITPQETRKWIKDGRIPTAKKRAFQKWGKSLETTLHEPQAIEELIRHVETWREESLTTAKILAKKWPGQLMGKGKNSFFQYPLMLQSHHLRLPLVIHVPIKRPTTGSVQQKAQRLDEQITQHISPLQLQASFDAFHQRVETSAQAYALKKTQFEDIVKTLLDEALSLDVNTAREQVESHLDAILAKAVTQFVLQYQSEQIKERIGLNDYPSFYPIARSLKRKHLLLVGPTNSGKTHAALNLLAKVQSGTYLAPLRLMALEGKENLSQRGVLCNMRTGEENITIEGAQHTSSTIEMLHTQTPVDVVVIDEIQMIHDPDRGWAWTQAVVGAPGKQIVMTGSPDAIPVIARISTLLGEELEVRSYTRKSPLQALSSPVQNVQPGDALIAFSRADVLRYREQLMQQNQRVACIYGALGPEVRRAEAERFRNGEASVLVATDAIGMGLNLPIKRVLFSALEKFDGTRKRPLTPNEIRQISGRAGRFGMAEGGFAGVLPGNDLGCIQAALETPPDPPKDVRAPLQAPWMMIEQVAQILDTHHLPKILHYTHQHLLQNDTDFKAPDLSNILRVAGALASSNLPLRLQHAYLGCPVDGRSPVALDQLAQWAKAHAGGYPVSAPTGSGPIHPKNHKDLGHWEEIAKQATTYLWLGLRWPSIYSETHAARALRDQANTAIENGLRAKNLSRTCKRCGQNLPKRHLFAICEDCFYGYNY